MRNLVYGRYAVYEQFSAQSGHFTTAFYEQLRYGLNP